MNRLKELLIKHGEKIATAFIGILCFLSVLNFTVFSDVNEKVELKLKRILTLKNLINDPTPAYPRLTQKNYYADLEKQWKEIYQPWAVFQKWLMYRYTTLIFEQEQLTNITLRTERKTVVKTPILQAEAPIGKIEINLSWSLKEEENSENRVTYVDPEEIKVYKRKKGGKDFEMIASFDDPKVDNYTDVEVVTNTVYEYKVVTSNYDVKVSLDGQKRESNIIEIKTSKGVYIYSIIAVNKDEASGELAVSFRIKAYNNKRKNWEMHRYTVKKGKIIGEKRTFPTITGATITIDHETDFILEDIKEINKPVKDYIIILKHRETGEIIKIKYNEARKKGKIFFKDTEQEEKQEEKESPKK